jgi:hypothetical protein
MAAAQPDPGTDRLGLLRIERRQKMQKQKQQFEEIPNCRAAAPKGIFPMPDEGLPAVNVFWHGTTEMVAGREP